MATKLSFRLLSLHLLLGVGHAPQEREALSGAGDSETQGDVPQDCAAGGGTVALVDLKGEEEEQLVIITHKNEDFIVQ